MTAQLPDAFLLGETRYAMLGSTGQEPFDPRALGIETVPLSTGCWRGYLCQYALDGEALVLDRLEIGLRPPAEGETWEPPAINGVIPIEPEPAGPSGHVYEAIGLALDYTGQMTLARDRIPGPSLSMMAPMAWDYESVVELEFEAGRLVGRRDVSETMAAIRERGIGHPLGPRAAAPDDGTKP